MNETVEETYDEETKKDKAKSQILNADTMKIDMKAPPTIFEPEGDLLMFSDQKNFRSLFVRNRAIYDDGLT